MWGIHPRRNTSFAQPEHLARGQLVPAFWGFLDPLAQTVGPPVQGTARHGAAAQCPSTPSWWPAAHDSQLPPRRCSGEWQTRDFHGQRHCGRRPWRFRTYPKQASRSILSSTSHIAYITFTTHQCEPRRCSGFQQYDRLISFARAATLSRRVHTRSRGQ